jgi:hypothetical protein
MVDTNSLLQTLFAGGADDNTSGFQALANAEPTTGATVLARLRGADGTAGGALGKLGSASGKEMNDVNGSRSGAFAAGLMNGINGASADRAVQQAHALALMKLQWEREHQLHEEKRNSANDEFTHGHTLREENRIAGNDQFTQRHTVREENRVAGNDRFTQEHTTRTDNLNEKKTNAEISHLGVPAGFASDPNKPGAFVPLPGGPADPDYLKKAAEAKSKEGPKVARAVDPHGNPTSVIATPDENAPGGIKVTPITVPPVAGKYSPKEQSAIEASDKTIQNLLNAKGAYEWLLGAHTDASTPAPTQVVPGSPNEEGYGGWGAGLKTGVSANLPFLPGADSHAAATTTEIDKRMTEQAAAQLKDYFGARPAFAADQKLFSITPSSGMTPEQRATVAAVQLDKVNRYLAYEAARRQALSNHTYYDGSGFNAAETLGEPAGPAKAASEWKPYLTKDGTQKFWNAKTGESRDTPPDAPPAATPPPAAGPAAPAPAGAPPGAPAPAPAGVPAAPGAPGAAAPAGAPGPTVAPTVAPAPAATPPVAPPDAPVAPPVDPVAAPGPAEPPAPPDDETPGDGAALKPDSVTSLLASLFGGAQPTA